MTEVLPTVINERDAQFFNFYLNGSVREGMFYYQEIYGKVCSFVEENRYDAFRLAIQLEEVGSRALVTISKSTCQVWIALRDRNSCTSTLIPNIQSDFQDFSSRHFTELTALAV